MVERPENEADSLMAERHEMPVCLLHRNGVVGRHGREVEVLRRRVDENDGQAQLQQPRVVIVRRIGLGVLAAGEDHAGHLPLEQHVDVLGL